MQTKVHAKCSSAAQSSKGCAPPIRFSRTLGVVHCIQVTRVVAGLIRRSKRCGCQHTKYLAMAHANTAVWVPTQCQHGLSLNYCSTNSLPYYMVLSVFYTVKTQSIKIYLAHYSVRALVMNNECPSLAECRGTPARPGCADRAWRSQSDGCRPKRRPKYTVGRARARARCSMARP